MLTLQAKPAGRLANSFVQLTILICLTYHGAMSQKPSAHASVCSVLAEGCDVKYQELLVLTALCSSGRGGERCVPLFCMILTTDDD